MCGVWLTCSVGRLGLDMACALLSQLMPGVPPADRELIYAYLGVATLGCGAGGGGGRDVAPDELLLLLRVLPMRYQGPQLAAAGTARPTTPSSNPLTAAGLGPGAQGRRLMA